MSPLKATFFVVFCLLSLAALGTAFSHFWKTDKMLVEETKQVSLARSQNPSNPPL
jgi:hypothetical protein